MTVLLIIGLAWTVAAALLGLLLARVIRAADRCSEGDSLFAFLEADLRGELDAGDTTRPQAPAAG